MLEEHITHPLDLIALLRFGRCYGSKVCVMCDDSIPFVRFTSLHSFTFFMKCFLLLVICTHYNSDAIIIII